MQCITIQYTLIQCFTIQGNAIECFHSRGQHLCKFIGTKESVCIRKEFNSQRIGMEYQHGRRFIGTPKWPPWRHVKTLYTIGHLHDGVILLLRPESFSFFLSYLNFVLCEVWITKALISTSRSSKMMSSCKWPIQCDTTHVNAIINDEIWASEG